MSYSNYSINNSEETIRADNDSPWKEVLEAYFPQAIQFFFPNTAALIDWQRPHQFLDKEFQKIIPDASIGRRYVDKLAKVWLVGGEEIWLLIHVEVQGTPEEDFSERMFSYNLRIYDCFRKGATSVAILCDADFQWRPKNFGFNYPDTRLEFEFGICKLLDYQNRFQELENSDNPFATVVMVHLKTQQTVKNAEQRKSWKFSLIKRLYEKGFQEKDIRNLYRFIDWVMILPKALEAEFWQDFKEFEQEKTMTYITTGERIGYERGKQEQGQVLIIRQLQKRVGKLAQELQTSIENLPLTELENLGEALLDFNSVDDLQNWLQNNQLL